jgi:hypothetical protein
MWRKMCIPHIVGNGFEPIRFLLPVCRFCWFLDTFNIHMYMHTFLSNYWWQESDIWSQASYRYAILWEAFLDLSDSYFLFADLVGFYTHWTYMHIFRHIFLSKYWWQRSDISSLCSMCIKINKVGKQEVGIWWVQKRFPRYGVPIWSLWPNIRFLSSIVA